MANVIMNAKDSLSAKLAECYVTINNNRYNFMQAINLEATVEKNKVQVPILGRTAKGNKLVVGLVKEKLNSTTTLVCLEDY